LSALGQIIDVLIYQPFSWLLRVLYEFSGSYGLALILFAFVTKVILLYFSARGKKAMMRTQRLQPKIKELEKQYGADKQKYQMAVQKLYQDEGVSMMGGCLWSLLPFPIFMALYTVIRQPFTQLMGLTAEQLDKIGQFLARFGVDVAATDPYRELMLSSRLGEHMGQLPADIAELPLIDINYSFLGLNLADKPSLQLSWLILIPIISGATAFLSMWIAQKISKQPAMQGSQVKMTMFLMPLVSVWFGFGFPGLLGIYWIAQNVFGIAQDVFLTKYYNKIFEREDTERAALEARRKAAEEAMREEQRQRRAAAIEAKKQKRKPGQTVYKIKNKPKPKNSGPEADD
jgi:YidC/Oxa1 family membrane protein insertase